MDSTMNLLERALAAARTNDPNISEAAFTRSFGLERTAISVARNRGNLSPVVAGQIAASLGEDVEHWIAVAAIESAKPSEAKSRLARMLNRARNS